MLFSFVKGRVVRQVVGALPGVKLEGLLEELRAAAEG